MLTHLDDRPCEIIVEQVPNLVGNDVFDIHLDINLCECGSHVHVHGIYHFGKLPIQDCGLLLAWRVTLGRGCVHVPTELLEVLQH